MKLILTETSGFFTVDSFAYFTVINAASVFTVLVKLLAAALLQCFYSALFT